MDQEILIDGSEGEGGGQIVRTALSLSLLTSKSFRIINVRAGRKNPGLAPQHLKAIQAAASISNSKVEGATLRSKEIYFEPGDVVRDNYHFDIGTAGSTILVFQTICFPLAWKAAGSRIVITGGTHVSHSPSYHYLERQWLFWMKRLGYEFQLEIKRAGYYPKGAGEIEARIGVHHKTPSLSLEGRGDLVDLNLISTFSSLPRHVAERQLNTAVTMLGTCGIQFSETIEEIPSISPGCQMLIHGQFQTGSCAYFALGERGKPAEKIGEEAASQFLEYLAGNGAIDQFLADQILVPAVFNKTSIRYTTVKVTQHLLTNRNIILKFIPCHISITGEVGQPGQVEITY